MNKKIIGFMVGSCFFAINNLCAMQSIDTSIDDCMTSFAPSDHSGIIYMGNDGYWHDPSHDRIIIFDSGKCQNFYTYNFEENQIFVCFEKRGSTLFALVKNSETNNITELTLPSFQACDLDSDTP